MSRIAFINIPGHGHVNPTLPVVEELTARGNQVVYYNTAEFRSRIEDAGATFRAYPPSAISTHAIGASVQSGNLFRTILYLLRATEPLFTFTVDELERERFGLVIFDSMALWGKMAALHARLPAIGSHTTIVLDGTVVPAGLLRLMLRQALPLVPASLVLRSRLARRHAQPFLKRDPIFPVRGDLNISFVAQDLQPASSLVDETFRFVGPSIRSGSRGESFPYAELSHGPIIYISLGTIHNTDAAFYRRCFEAFTDYPAQFILSAGSEAMLHDLGAVPRNFIVRASVPQVELLEHVDAFVTHAGMNSVHEALYHGVPMVLIPHQAEQLLNAFGVEARGAGVILHDQVARKRLSPKALRQALDEVLEPRYREAARTIGGSLRATGGYLQAVDEIQTFLDHRRASGPPSSDDEREHARQAFPRL